MNTGWPIKNRKPSCVVIVVALFFAMTMGTASAQETSKPKRNIILIMADDMGWGDPGYNGNMIIQTPNLDQMSREGLRFNRFYSGSSVCSPTRASCLTGRNGYRMGIRTANQGHLPESEICIAEVLKEHGYQCGHFGKWHLGTLSPDYSGKGANRKPKQNYSHPGMNGFDQWFSTEFAVATWDPYKPEHSHLGKRMKWDPRALYWENGKNVSEPLTGDDSRIIMDKALPFIETSIDNGKPFFSVIWFHTPHTPVIGGPAYLEKYKDHDPMAQHYFACITAMDEQIGRLRKKLKQLGADENTIIWFCSDNGPEGPKPTGRNQGSQGVLRGRKRSLYEGGVRVPGILVWPQKIAAQRTTDVPCVTSDFFPTICELVGQSLPADRHYDGMSLVSLIENKMDQRNKPIFFQFGKQASVIDGSYKLVHNPAAPKRPARDTSKDTVKEWELYNISNDIGESTNIIDSNSAIADRLRQQLTQWKQSCKLDADNLNQQLNRENQP